MDATTPTDRRLLSDDGRQIYAGDRVRIRRTVGADTVTVGGLVVAVTPEGGLSLKGINPSAHKTVEEVFPHCDTLPTGITQSIELRREARDFPRCEHGSYASYVTVVDYQARTDADPYGDVEGPLHFEHINVARHLRDSAGRRLGHARFAIGLIHADRCRTEH